VTGGSIYAGGCIKTCQAVKEKLLPACYVSQVAVRGCPNEVVQWQGYRRRRELKWESRRVCRIII
jgi:hypothetical protein